MKQRLRGLSLHTRILAIVLAAVFVACWFFAWQILRTTREQVLEQAYESTLHEHLALGGSLTNYAETLLLRAGPDEGDGYTAELVTNAAYGYGQYYRGDKAGFCVLLDDQLLYNSIPAALWESLAIAPQEGTVVYGLQRTGEISYIAAASWLQIGSVQFALYSTQDVSALLAQQMGLAQWAALLLAVTGIVIGAAVYFLLRRTLRPLERLAGGAAAIAQGNYASRLPEPPYNDEVGRLTEDFNRMAASVQNHTRALQDEARRKELFSANLAHEIKTPITSIVGYADLAMRTQPEPDKLYELLGHIHREGTRIDRLAHTMMEWSQAGNMRPEIAAIRTEKLLRSLQLTLAPVLEARAQRLNAQAEPAIVQADEALLTSLAVNLVRNAANASGEGAEIALTIQPRETGFALTVTDTGCGIAAGELDNIREPFYMVDKSRSRQQHGAGLGLALCEVIVKAHGGTLHIESAPGKGTRVTALFPDV